MTRWPSIIIVAGSTVLMQLHAVQFWTAHVGAAGVAWSLILEAVALWLWWQRRRTLAVLASALLIAGPFYQLSAPTVDALRNAQASASMLVMERAEVAQLEASLSRYQDNSAERLGWADRIDRAQAALDAARVRVRELVTAQADGAGWREVGVVAMQAFALLVVMVTQVLAVGHLRTAGVDTDAEQLGAIKKAATRERVKASSKNMTPVTSEPPTDIDTLAKLVALEIETDLATRNESQKAAALRLDVRPADVSMIRNHAARRNDGKETVSTSVLHRLAKHYNIEHGSRNA